MLQNTRVVSILLIKLFAYNTSDFETCLVSVYSQIQFLNSILLLIPLLLGTLPVPESSFFEGVIPN